MSKSPLTHVQVLSDFEPLSPAEAIVVSRLGSGEFDRVGEGEPGIHTPERLVRAELLRFLILGGDKDYPLHEKGLRVSGARITGILDLEGCRIYRDLGLRDCHFDSAPVLRSAIVDSLFLDRSVLPGLRADRLEARGDISLRGATLMGGIRIVGARLGGSLAVDGATIEAPEGLAIDADRFEARGNILLRGARIKGGINVSGITIGGDLNLARAMVDCPDDIAINGEGLEARGDIVLRDANVSGEVRLWGASFGGNVDCTSSTLRKPGAYALSLNRARINGVFFLRRKAIVEGKLDLTASSVGAIFDDSESWPHTGNLVLNRCLFGAIIGGPVDAESRLEWLARQGPSQLFGEFLPQPYEQLALVLRQMGHNEDSQAILIEKERLQRRARRKRSPYLLMRWLLAVSDGILAVTVRYGHQPLYAFIWLTLFWAIGAIVFDVAHERGAFKPNSAVVLRSLEWTMCSLEMGQTRYMPTADTVLPGRALPGQGQLECFLAQPEATSYPEMNSAMYSLDTLLPVTELGQKEFWRPDPRQTIGRIALSYFYLQSLLGWSLSLLAVAGFSGLVKSR
ncbi:MAG: hypothetical protein KF810_16505 [Rhizobiaceae bacterium]|nr:hypothetical protein [Rhizobiaceae bacterium]